MDLVALILQTTKSFWSVMVLWNIGSPWNGLLGIIIDYSMVNSAFLNNIELLNCRLSATVGEVGGDRMAT